MRVTHLATVTSPGSPARGGAGGGRRWRCLRRPRVQANPDLTAETPDYLTQAAKLEMPPVAAAAAPRRPGYPSSVSRIALAILRSLFDREPCTYPRVAAPWRARLTIERWSTLTDAQLGSWRSRSGHTRVCLTGGRRAGRALRAIRVRGGADHAVPARQRQGRLSPRSRPDQTGHEGGDNPARRRGEGVGSFGGERGCGQPLTPWPTGAASPAIGGPLRPKGSGTAGLVTNRLTADAFQVGRGRDMPAPHTRRTQCPPSQPSAAALPQKPR
jgi:hypothetical protein